MLSVLGPVPRDCAGVEAQPLIVDAVAYRHVICAPAELELHWKSDGGEVMRTFAAVTRELERSRREPVFLMNGGIFEPGGIPSGLLVVDGKSMGPLNTKPGKGNFFLKTNGVFFVTSKGPTGILESARHAREKPAVRIAVQSGPLLLHEGRIHPAFRKGSPNLLHRNGAGVDKDGRVHFLITDRGQKAVVNLHGFAEAFRSLQCANALFLDGDISQCFLADGGGRLAS